MSMQDWKARLHASGDYMSVLAVSEIWFFQRSGQSLEDTLQGNQQEMVCPIQEPSQNWEEPTI